MKLDRLLGILTVLLQKDRVTAPYLAEKFEVTRRTIGRDIDALCQAGIPVITQQGSGGGISIADGFKLDKSVLTKDELSGIIAALKGIGSVSDKYNTEKVLDKLCVGKDTVVSLQEPIVIDLASHYKGSLTAKIEAIKQAIHEQKNIEFDYYYEKGKIHRCIEPYFVIFQWTAWYVFGYCHMREDWRMFKLTRLWDLQLCEETFICREIPSEKREFNAFFADAQKLIALFDPSVRYQLIEMYGMDYYTETKEGLLRLEIEYTKQDHMIEWLLSFGGNVKVLEPKEIAESICEAAQKILKVYKQT